jgi:hypothetical protein
MLIEDDLEDNDKPKMQEITEVNPLFENEEEEMYEDMNLFVDEELQNMFSQNSDEDFNKIMQMNIEKTRMSMNINMNPQLLQNFKMEKQNQIEKGNIVTTRILLKI